MKSPLIRNYIMMFIFYIIDSTINYFVPFSLTKSGITYISSLSLIVFSLLVMDFNDNAERLFFSTICGLYYSIVYSNSLLVYILIYLFITFFRTFIYASKNLNIIEFLGMVIIILSAKELIIYILIRITNVSDLSLFRFILLRFLPTIFINTLISPIFYYLSIKMDKEENIYERLG